MRLEKRLQHVQCEHEKLKRENRLLKEALMQTAQQHADRKDEFIHDKKMYESLLRDIKVATNNAEDCRYLAELEKERRIAQVTQLKRQLSEAKQKLREQEVLFDIQEYVVLPNAKRTLLFDPA